MEMCPYCGEEVPQDSSKCWKCGTELAEGAAKSEGDDLEVPDDDDEDGATAVIECPFCGSPAPKKALRCKECGRTIQKVKTGAQAALLWKWGVWAVVLIVGLSSLTAVILYARHRSASEERARNTIGASYDDLVKRLQPRVKGFKEERRREVWEKDMKGRFVHWTDGFVCETPVGNVVRIRQAAKGGEADVEVTFGQDQGLSDLKPDEKIEYSARLVDYGRDPNEPAFKLDEGTLDKPDKK